MSDILQKNLALLKTHQPHIFEKLNLYILGKYKPLENSIDRILLANCDDIIINLLVVSKNGQFAICDNEDPIGQAYEWIDKYIDPSNKANIVFGMGFAYHLEVLLTSFKNKKVIIIEPNIELFYQIFRVRNMELIIKKSEIFLDEKLNVILHRINSLFWDTEKGGIQCQPFEVYAEIFTSFWDELRSKFIKQAENFNVDISTRRFLSDLWIHNYIKNSKKLFDASNAYGLTGRFKEIPGILVSAGPSLSKNIHLLKGLKDKAVIMAAGEAARILDDNNIHPHFMVGIDALEGEADMHKKIKSTEIYFIYSNQVATGSVQFYTGSKFFMNYSADSYTNDFMKFAGIHSGMFLSGPSVANTCFDILLKMGCNPIILIGQDLAYTSGSSYAGEEQGSQLKNSKDFEKDGYILKKDINGNDIYTILPFIAMKNWFEGYFERVKSKVDIFNATEGGLNIEFAENVRLKELLDEKDFKSFEIEGLIKKVYDECHFTDEINLKLDVYKKNLLGEVEKLESQTNELMKISDMIKKDIYHPNRDKKAFDKMIGRINNIFDNVINSPIYDILLKNLIEIEFYLIKLEVERGSSQTANYNELKGLYIDAISKQHRILADKLGKLKELLMC